MDPSSPCTCKSSFKPFLLAKLTLRYAGHSPPACFMRICVAHRILALDLVVGIMASHWSSKQHLCRSFLNSRVSTTKSISLPHLNLAVKLPRHVHQPARQSTDCELPSLCLFWELPSGVFAYRQGMSSLIHLVLTKPGRTLFTCGTMSTAFSLSSVMPLPHEESCVLAKEPPVMLHVDRIGERRNRLV